MRRRYWKTRVRLDRHTGEAVLTISYRDLREILTAAALHTYESDKEASKRLDPGETLEYNKGLRKHCDDINKILDEQITGGSRYERRQNGCAGEMSLEDRREAVAEAKRERALFDKMLRGLREEREARKSEAAGRTGERR